jgi:ATP-dependent helicase/nuclease subunit A
MSNNVTVVSAGAGSGKTYRLADEVLKAVKGKTARPEAILLTTFTRKAATELEERVRIRLLETKAWEEAQRLRQAWIGTIDSVCLRLIQEHAFKAGQSPELSVFGPGEELIEFNRSLTDIVGNREWTLLEQLSTSLSLGPSYGSESDWRTLVKEIADGARSNRIAPEQLADSARKSLDGYLRLFSKSAKSAEALDRKLATAMETAAAALEKNIASGADGTKTTLNALETLQAIRGRLRAKGQLSWTDWVKLFKLNVGKKSSPLIGGLTAAASCHFEHPRLRDEIVTFVTLLFKLAEQSLKRFEERKRAAGLLDFIDLEERGLDLLDKPPVRAALSQKLDLVLVDEFQDTSPIQLALFLKLSELAKRSVWVGDQKQSIFDFRGADPLLMQSVLESIKADDRLDTSYRSRPALVRMVNEAFSSVFPTQGIKEKIDLKANRKEILKSQPCESWVLNTKNSGTDCEAIAERIQFILDNAQQYPIVDRRTKQAWPIRAGDIAVLARANSVCIALADAIAKRGISVELARPGLIGSPEVILSLAALRIFLNPTDSMAAAQLTFLCNARDGQVEAWLLPRLEEYSAWRKARDEGEQPGPGLTWGDDPVLKDILAHRRDYGFLSPVEILQEAIKLSRVRDMCVRWGDTARRLANLEKLMAIAGDYQQTAQVRGEASSIAGLLTYLNALSEDDKDEQALAGADAVNVSTYHRAKGLEWHMVILYQLHQEPGDSVFDLSVEASTSFDWEKPLRGRWIRYWPWPYGNHKTGVSLDQAVLETTEYQRAREKALHEEIRLLYVGMTRARDYLVLAARPGKHAWLDLLKDKQGVKTFELPQNGEKTRAQSQFQVVPLGEAEPQEPKEQSVQWFAGTEKSAERAKKIVFCSNLTVPAESLSQVTAVPEKIMERIPMGGNPDMTSLGNAVHAFLCCDSSALPISEREQMAAELLAANNVIGALKSRDLISIYDRFFAFVGSRWPDAKIRREWPLALNLEKFELHGAADLVLESRDGLIIIDHKTFPGSLDDLTKKAKSFAAQIVAYRGAIEKTTGKSVLATLIHFPVSGYLVNVAVKDGPDTFIKKCISANRNKEASAVT